MTSPLILPDPACSFGYPLGQVFELLKDGGDDRYGEFLQWMLHRKVANCDPRRSYNPSSCSIAHGPVVYPVDLARFLQQAAA